MIWEAETSSPVQSYLSMLSLRPNPKETLGSGQQLAEFLRLGIHKLLPLIIPQERAILVAVKDVVRIQRDLPAAPWGVHHKLWYRIPGRMTPKPLNNLQTFPYRSAKMSRAFNEIALIQVVGFYPAEKKLMNKSSLHVHAVVDSLEENGLVAERDTRIGEAAKRIPHLTG